MVYEIRPLLPEIYGTSKCFVGVNGTRTDLKVA